MRKETYRATVPKKKECQKGTVEHANEHSFIRKSNGDHLGISVPQATCPRTNQSIAQLDVPWFVFRKLFMNSSNPPLGSTTRTTTGIS